ncbi:hypothetical protein C2G38_2233416 [Gigaspora rosea]|uniref:BTB domain-containing protein n=1 Tax=Gigaspora rosea TaxID=44941 RepID=A0A397TR73_9GLOM|nr:hypothetical protein C2G38_2233416 [Gigaspora rosea]
MKKINIAINVGESPNIKVFRSHTAILKYRFLYFHNELMELGKDKNNIKTPNLNKISIQQFEIIIKQDNKLQDLQNWCNDMVVKYPNKIFDSEEFFTLQENASESLITRDDFTDEILGGYNPIGWDSQYFDQFRDGNAEEYELFQIIKKF